MTMSLGDPRTVGSRIRRKMPQIAQKLWRRPIQEGMERAGRRKAPAIVPAAIALAKAANPKPASSAVTARRRAP